MPPSYLEAFFYCFEPRAIGAGGGGGVANAFGGAGGGGGGGKVGGGGKGGGGGGGATSVEFEWHDVVGLFFWADNCRAIMEIASTNNAFFIIVVLSEIQILL